MINRFFELRVCFQSSCLSCLRLGIGFRSALYNNEWETGRSYGLILTLVLCKKYEVEQLVYLSIFILMNND